MFRKRKWMQRLYDKHFKMLMWNMRAVGAKALTDWDPHKGGTLWDWMSNSHITLICLRGDIVYFDYTSWCGKVMVIKHISERNVERSTPVNKLTRTVSQDDPHKIPFYWQLGVLHTNSCMKTDAHTHIHTLTLNVWHCCVVDHQVSLMCRECKDSSAEQTLPLDPMFCVFILFPK